MTTDQDKTQLFQGSQDHEAVFLSKDHVVDEEPRSVDNITDKGFSKAGVVETEGNASLSGQRPTADQEATLLNPELEAASQSPYTESSAFLKDVGRSQSAEQENDLSTSGKSYFTLGSVIKNRFQILESLGEGGMGMVFKAIDIRKLEARSRNPHVAIKVLNPALARNAVLVAALQRECEKAQALSHPNIITVYDFDRDGDQVFMSMEYLAGQPLTQIIRDAGLAGGMKIERAWPIIRKMGEALAYAHKKQIVHSDFKPANVFVTDSGEVKVLDFGIASKLDHADNADLTVFDARLEGGHTPPYASLEMMNGGKADPRDDIYAFGLVVYEMLTGQHPYQRKPASKVFFEQQREGKVPKLKPIPGLSRKQWRLLKSALELLQAQRPKSLDEWLLEFEPKSGKNYLKAGIWLLSFLIFALIALGWFFRQKEDFPQTHMPSAVSVAVKPPLASVNQNTLQVKQGVPVVLDGSASKSEDGGAIAFDWRIVDRPEGSKSVLIDANSMKPQIVPDRPGHYAVELVVIDAENRHSLPALVTIDVSTQPPGSSELLQQASSVDGLLYVAAGKSQYKIGEDLTLSIRLAKSGYLRVAYVGANGEISDLLPNQYQTSKVKADVEYRIPPRANTFKLQVTGPVGVDKIIAVFSVKTLPKVDTMVNRDGSLVTEMIGPDISTVLIGYDVLKKSG